MPTGFDAISKIKDQQVIAGLAHTNFLMKTLTKWSNQKRHNIM